MKIRIRHNILRDEYYIQKKPFLCWHIVTYQWSSGNLTSSFDESTEYFSSLYIAEQAVQKYLKYLAYDSESDPIISVYNTRAKVELHDVEKLTNDLRKTEVGSDEEKEILTKLGLI